MTARQRDLRDFIARFQTDSGGTSPSFAEMMAGIGAKSKSNISFLLAQLEREGRIRRTHRRARDIIIVPEYAVVAERLRAA